MDYEDIIGDIISNEGIDAAKNIMKVKGGLERVYFPFPNNLKDSHWLAVAIGMEKATSICERIGGGHCAIRKSLENAAAEAIKALIKQGKSASEIAIEVGVHQRTVRRHRRRLRLQEAIQKAQRGDASEKFSLACTGQNVRRMRSK